MEQIKIYLCDDEPKILADLSEQVRACVPDALIKGFISGRELIAALQTEPCDILLLDIDMPDMSGMEIAAWLMKLEKRPLLVFVTSHDELVYDSFWYHPFGFIRKGYFKQEIKKVLDACIKERSSSAKYFMFRTEGKELRLPLNEIRYFEADGNYLKVFGTSEEYRVRSTVTAVENSFGDCGFIRIHKGFLVNQSVVRAIGSDEVQLSGGEVLPLGKTYAEEAKKQFMRYMRG